MKRKPKRQQSKQYTHIIKELQFQMKRALKCNDIALQIRLARAIIAFEASIGTNIFNELTLDTYNYYMNEVVHERK